MVVSLPATNGTLQRIAHRVRSAARAFRAPPSGRVYEFDPNLDALHSPLTRNLDFKRIASILRQVQEGDITEALRLFDEMEHKDPRLYSVAQTRRLALTGLDWEVVSAADVQTSVEDKELAEDAAAFIRERFDALRGFDCALEHLSTAIGPNLADWYTYTELFGMPIRFATFRSYATTEEKRMMVEMLKNMGTKAWGAFSESCNVQFLESPQRSSSPYEGLLNYCNREQSILWLGGNLTSDTTGGTGTFAAATVQDEVRRDLRDDDIKRESRTVRDQIIRPMVQRQFPGRDVPVPYFRRIKPEVVDRAKEAGVMMQAQKMGMDVPEDWARDVLAIPKPKVDEQGNVP